MSRFCPLTFEQQEMLPLVAAGLTDYEIGLRLHYSASSIKLQLGHMRRLTGTQTRCQLIVVALMCGWINRCTLEREIAARIAKGTG